MKKAFSLFFKIISFGTLILIDGLLKSRKLGIKLHKGIMLQFEDGTNFILQLDNTTGDITLNLKLLDVNHEVIDSTHLKEVK